MLVKYKTQCSLFKKPYLTLQLQHPIPQLKIPITSWRKDTSRCSDAYFMSYNDDCAGFANDMSWRKHTEVHCTGLSGNSNPFLVKRHSQILRVILCSKVYPFQVGPTVLVSSRCQQFSQCLRIMTTGNICPENFRLVET